MEPLRALPRLSPGNAVWRGTLTALVLALPAGILNQFAARDGATLWTLVLWLVIMFGAASGGYAVRRLCPSARLHHAAAAGALAYVIVQSIGVVRRLASGETISWLAYPFLALLMASVAMLGGVYATRITGRYGEQIDGGPVDAGEDT